MDRPEREATAVTRLDAFGPPLTVAALVVAIAAIAATQLRLGESRRTIGRMSAPYARAVTQDRLMGRQLDLAALGVRREADTDRRPVLLWILDLERCVGCFDTVSEWKILEALDSHEPVVILTGPVTPDVRARLRVMPRTRPVLLRRDSVFAVTGPVLANTKLLLAGDGTVLMADTRSGGQECGWSFEAMVGAVLGLGSADRIRAGPG